jgi:hypothetical protein
MTYRQRIIQYMEQRLHPVSADELVAFMCFIEQIKSIEEGVAVSGLVHALLHEMTDEGGILEIWEHGTYVLAKRRGLIEVSQYLKAWLPTDVHDRAMVMIQRLCTLKN